MLCVRDIMTSRVVTLTPEATIREAMETLSTNHLSGAPVISGNKVVGVISMSDILGLLISSPEPVTAESSPSLADEWDDTSDDLADEDETEAASLSEDVWDEWTQGSEGRIDDATPLLANLLDQRTVAEAMNAEVFSVPPGATVSIAATMMRERGIHRVLVIRRNVLLGIVSALDIVRAVSDKGIAGQTGIRTEALCDEPSRWITR
jgi:CBS domain-containing protein